MFVEVAVLVAVVTVFFVIYGKLLEQLLYRWFMHFITLQKVLRLSLSPIWLLRLLYTVFMALSAKSFRFYYSLAFRAEFLSFFACLLSFFALSKAVENNALVVVGISVVGVKANGLLKGL